MESPEEELYFHAYKGVTDNSTYNASPTGNGTIDPCQNLDHTYFYETLQKTFLWIILICIVAGNSIVLAAVGLSRGGRRSRMTFFIIQLAIADILVGVVGVLTDVLWKTTVSWEGGFLLCKLVRYLGDVVYYASTYVLVSLSIDRLDAIARPMSFSGSGLRAKILIAVAWILSFIFSIPMLVLTQYDDSSGSGQCGMNLDLWAWQVYFTLITVALFVMPACIIILCYAVIIYIVWSKSKLIQPAKRSNRRTRQNGNSLCDGRGDERMRGNSRASSRGVIPQAKIRTIKMTLVIVLVFIFCWSPFFIFNILQVYDYIPCTNEMVALGTFIQSLAPLNSAANPIIYGIFSTRVCRYLRKVPLFNWIALHVFPCCIDRHFRRFSAPVTAATATEYSTMTEADTRGTSISHRRPSGLPFVRNSLSEKENEILLKTIKTNVPGHCEPLILQD